MTPGFRPAKPFTRLVIVPYEEESRESFRGREDLARTQATAMPPGVGMRLPELAGATLIYASARSRPLDAAMVIAKENGIDMVVSDPRLDDIDFGAWTGLTSDEVAERWPALYCEWLTTPETVRFPDGESISGVISRLREAVLAYRRRNEGSTTVVVAGEMVTRLLVGDARQKPLASIHCDDHRAAVSVLDWSESGSPIFTTVPKQNE